MEIERHDTHILSSKSSEDDFIISSSSQGEKKGKNKNNQVEDLESEKSVYEPPNNKIGIKEIFKDMSNKFILDKDEDNLINKDDNNIISRTEREKILFDKLQEDINIFYNKQFERTMNLDFTNDNLIIDNFLKINKNIENSPKPNLDVKKNLSDEKSKKKKQKDNLKSDNSNGNKKNSGKFENVKLSKSSFNFFIREKKTKITKTNTTNNFMSKRSNKKDFNKDNKRDDTTSKNSESKTVGVLDKNETETEPKNVNKVTDKIVDKKNSTFIKDEFTKSKNASPKKNILKKDTKKNLVKKKVEIKKNSKSTKKVVKNAIKINKTGKLEKNEKNIKNDKKLKESKKSKSKSLGKKTKKVYIADTKDINLSKEKQSDSNEINLLQILSDKSSNIFNDDNHILPTFQKYPNDNKIDNNKNKISSFGNKNYKEKMEYGKQNPQNLEGQKQNIVNNSPLNVFTKLQGNKNTLSYLFKSRDNKNENNISSLSQKKMTQDNFDKGQNNYDKESNIKYKIYNSNKNNEENQNNKSQYLNNNIPEKAEKNNNNNFGIFPSNRLISANFLFDRSYKKIKSKKKNENKTISPYLSNIIISKRALKKSYSNSNLLTNRVRNLKQNYFRNSQNMITNQFGNINNNNDINLNFYKTNSIFNFIPKNNSLIPFISKARESKLKSAYLSNKIKDKKGSISVLPIEESKNNVKVYKSTHNSKRGFGKHYGKEKECPICQSMSIKSNYLMKNMNNYIDLKKQKDWSMIKIRKEQFLQSLKHTQKKKKNEMDLIIKEIKDYLFYTTMNKDNKVFLNKDLGRQASFINEYFDK